MEFGLAIGFIIISLVALKLCRQCAGIVAVIYFLAIIYIAFISREPAPYLRYSFNPFGAVKRGLEFGCGVLQGIFSCDIRVTSWVSLKGIILNILLFVPFGYLLPTLFPQLKWWQVILLALTFSLCIEFLQLLTRLGYADIDDMINNTCGAAIGFLCCSLFLKPCSTTL